MPRRFMTLLLLSAVLVIAALLSAAGTWAAFSGTTSNPSNTFGAGTVIIADDDSGGAMLTMNNVRPASSDTSCIEVNYAGTLPAHVRFYGTTTGTGLDQYLDLTVTRGTIVTPAFDSCTGFAADGTNYAGLGAGVIYTGSLQGFPDNYAAGINYPSTQWASNTKAVYKLTVTAQDNNGAQGKNATQDFTWEARDS